MEAALYKGQGTTKITAVRDCKSFSISNQQLIKVIRCQLLQQDAILNNLVISSREYYFKQEEQNATGHLLLIFSKQFRPYAKPIFIFNTLFVSLAKMSGIRRAQTLGYRGLSQKMDPEVSIFHLIIWLFLVPQKITQEQVKKINRFYFSGNNEKIGFNPICSKQKELEDTITCITEKNNKCLIKVVVSDKIIPKVQLLLGKNKRVIEVYQFIQNPNLLNIQRPNQSNSESKALEPQSFDYFHSKRVEKSADLNYFLQKAEKQVQKFTKNFRTFYNSLPLINHFAQDANRYRLHLLSSINMKTSDLLQSLDHFNNFCSKQFRNMSQHIGQIENNKLHNSQYLGEYPQLAKQFIKNQIQYASEVLNIKKQEHKKQNFDKKYLQKMLNNLQKQFDKKREIFYIKVLDTYQGQRFYYQILNATLKTVTEKSKSILYINKEVQRRQNKAQISFVQLSQIEPMEYQQKKQAIQNIKYVSLPFSQTYKAINFFYRQALEKEMSGNCHPSTKFYTNPFTVYRGGRVNKSQFEYYKANKNEMFIQFYGFVSTSQDVRVALQFAENCKKHKDSQQYRNDYDQGDDLVCIFQIKCRFNKEIVNYSFANHGFFRYNKQNARKDIEKEVLFNSLNIFKLVDVRKVRIIDLLPRAQKQRYEAKQRAYVDNENERFHRENLKKYYQSQINIIQLEYGSFHDVLLEDNPRNLQNWQIEAKQNYVYYMNKALKYKFQKFDFADACQLLNQLEKAYEYLKAKVSQNFSKCYQKDSHQNEDFGISQIDGKNYCLRLSQICLKLGKSQEGLYYAKLSEKCHEVMSKYEMRQIYNNHYQRFFQMQSTIVNILQENSDFLNAQRQLKRQIQCITSKKFTDPKAKLRQSEININLGVNQFEIGRLKESLQIFRNCSMMIEFALKQITVTEIEEPTWKDYFSNCCLPQSIFCWCKYFEVQKERRRKEKKQKLENYYGGQQQLCETESMVKDVSSIAKETFRYQLKFCKNQAEYQQILRKFNANIQKQAIFKKKKPTEEQKMQAQIKSIIMKISSLQVNSQEYDKNYELLKQKVELINKNQKEKIVYSNDKPEISEFIEKFRERQRKRRISHLKEKKKLLMTRNYEKFKTEYMKEVEQIKHVITQLKKEGYLDNTTHVLKLQNSIAKILFQGQQYHLALKQVENIIKYDDEAYERKHFQLASAYFTQASIHCQLKNAQVCLQTAQKALQHLEMTFLQNRTLKDIDIKTEKLSQLSQAIREEEVTDQEKVVQILKQHNLFLEIKILKAKAYLLQYDDLQVRNKQLRFQIQEQQGNPTQRNNVIKAQIETNTNQIQRIQCQIQKLLVEVTRALEKKDKIQDINDLKIQVLQTQTLFILRKKINLQKGFSLLMECLALRNQKIGHPNAANILLCSEIVLKHYLDPEVHPLIEKHQIKKQISQNHFHFENLSFYQTIKKAMRTFQNKDMSEQNKNQVSSARLQLGDQTHTAIRHNVQEEDIIDFDLKEQSDNQDEKMKVQQSQKAYRQVPTLPPNSAIKSKITDSTQSSANFGRSNTIAPLNTSYKSTGLMSQDNSSNQLSQKRKKRPKGSQVQKKLPKQKKIPEQDDQDDPEIDKIIKNTVKSHNPRRTSQYRQSNQNWGTIRKQPGLLGFQSKYQSPMKKVQQKPEQFAQYSEFKQDQKPYE